MMYSDILIIYLADNIFSEQQGHGQQNQARVKKQQGIRMMGQI